MDFAGPFRAMDSFRVRVGPISRDGLRSRERLAAPVAEVRDVTFNRSCSLRSRPHEPVSDRFVPDEERKRAERDGDEPSAVRFLKRFAVFNTDQCEDLPQERVSAPSPIPKGLRVPHADVLIAATGADFRIGGDRAFYNPTYDFIQVPPPDAYFEPINWHRTALHELGHWTGAAIVISPVASDRRGMPRRSWSPRSPAPSCVLRLASYQRCAMPTILAPGSKSCARIIALSFAPPQRCVKSGRLPTRVLPRVQRMRRRCRVTNHLLVSDRQETCAW
jgi:Zincin-like metallopeptidase